VQNTEELRPVFELFEDNEHLQRYDWFDDIEEAMQGEEILYEVVDASGEKVGGIWRYHKLHETEGGSPVLEDGEPIPLDREGILDGFSVDLKVDYEGNKLQEAKNRIANSHATEYFEVYDQVEDERSLGSFQIPESYDPETLEETVEGAVNMVRDAAELQSQIDNTVDQFIEEYGLQE